MREFGLHSLAPVARAHTLGLQGTLPGVANLQSTSEWEGWKPRCSGLSSKPGMCVEIQPKSGMVVHACHFSTEKIRQGAGYEFQATLGSIEMLLKERITKWGPFPWAKYFPIISIPSFPVALSGV